LLTLAMRPRVKITKEGKVRIDAELWNTWWCLLRAGQEQQLGNGHQFRASLAVGIGGVFESYFVVP
jgi:hypothetical protein